MRAVGVADQIAVLRGMALLGALHPGPSPVLPGPAPAVQRDQ